MVPVVPPIDPVPLTLKEIPAFAVRVFVPSEILLPLTVLLRDRNPVDAPPTAIAPATSMLSAEFSESELIASGAVPIVRVELP